MAFKTYVLVVAVFLFSVICVAFPVKTTKWLALGQEITERDSLEFDREEYRLTLAYLTTSTIGEVGFRARKGNKINFILACSIHMNGHVAVVRGGLDQEEVVLRYDNENGKSDEFFIIVQSCNENRTMGQFNIIDNVAETSNIAIVTDELRKWT